MEGSPSIFNRILARFGWVPILVVRGRRTGLPRSVPVAPVAHDGARYLVSVHGQSNWARNLATAGVGELQVRGKTEAFRAVEVTGDERVAAVAAYRKAFGRWMKGLEATPAADGQPVFRIEPLDESQAA